MLRSIVAVLLIGLLIAVKPALTVPPPNEPLASEGFSTLHYPGSTSLQHTKDDMLIKFKPEVTDEEAIEELEEWGCTQVEKDPKLNIRRALIPKNATPEEMVAYARGYDTVEYAECNYIREGVVVPNDPYFTPTVGVTGYQWGPKRFAAETAWNTTTGSSSTLVAVLDSGVDYNTVELPLNTKVIKGYDFVNNDNDPMDDAGHGTLVSGALAAMTNNNFGIAGTAWAPKILAVKVLDNQLQGTDFNIAKGIRYSADYGAQILNLSLGQTAPSAVLDDAVVYAREQGSAVIAAAGNNGQNEIFYPGGSPGAVNVSATRGTTRYEQTTAVQSGTWTQATANGFSEWTALYSGTTGSKLTFTITGNVFFLIGTPGPSGGIGDIYIDGSYAGSADFYRSNSAYLRKVYASPMLSNGTHTVEVRVSGRKNSASSGYFLNIDAIDVDQERETRAGFSNYGPSIDLSAPGENIWVNYLNNLFFYVNGTSLSSPYAAGVAALALAQNPTLTADQLSRFIQETTVGLGPGGWDQYYGYGRLNAAAAVSATMDSVEQDSPAITYAGGWTDVIAGGASAGSYKLSGNAGSTAMYSFTGTSFNWVALKGPSQGIASVTLDGIPQGDIDLYSMVNHWQSLVFRADQLGAGPHTIVITVTGTKNPSSAGYYVTVDAFDSLTYADTTPPNAPTGPSISRSGSNFTISWTASAGGATGYIIERSLDQINWSPAGLSETTSYVDQIQPTDQFKTWYYRVRAYDLSNNRSGYSGTVSMFMPDVTPPYNPYNLAVVRSGNKNQLTWGASGDNVALAGYKLERAFSANGPWVEIATPSSNSYANTLSYNVTLYYRVRAYDTSGNNSEYSNVAEFSVAVNDATGDGLSDLMAFYNYGSGSTGAWVYKAIAGASYPFGIAFSPGLWWKSGGGTFDLSKMKIVTGDFNGDGLVDAMAFYNYGGNTSGIFFFRSLGSSYASPVKVFSSGAWNWGNTKPAAGDVNGDGRDDVIAFYSYGGTKTGVFVFYSNSNGTLQSPRQVFYSANWNWSRTRLLSVQDNFKSKVVAAYNYGGSSMGLWNFPFNADGTLNYPTLAFMSNQWDYSKTKFITGDLNGDTKGDVIAFYAYGGNTTGAFVFTQTGSTFAYPRSVFFSTRWDSTKATYVPGDFNGDGFGDAGAVYNYGGTTIGAWVFFSNGSNLGNAGLIYSTSSWNNSATRWVMPY